MIAAPLGDALLVGLQVTFGFVYFPPSVSPVPSTTGQP